MFGFTSTENIATVAYLCLRYIICTDHGDARAKINEMSVFECPIKSKIKL